MRWGPPDIPDPDATATPGPANVRTWLIADEPLLKALPKTRQTLVKRFGVAGIKRLRELEAEGAVVSTPATYRGGATWARR